MNDHLGWNGQVHGVARLFQLWTTHLDSERYDVSVCVLSKREGLGKALEGSGARVSFLGNGKYNPLTLWALVNLVRRENIDVLHVQGYRGTTLGKIAGMVTGVPVIVHFHDTSLFYPLLQRISDNVLRNAADAYLAVSYASRDMWAQRCKLDPDRITVVHNCTSLAEFRPTSATEVETVKSGLGIGRNSRVIGTVARLFESKGIRYLLEAAPAVLREFPDSRFVIVGDGPLREELERLAVGLNLDKHVLFTGFTDDVGRLMSIFDICVLPSVSAEGLPLTVLEAMAMAKPVIATEVVEIIEDGTDGLIVPRRDPKALATKIIHVLGNQQEAKRLGTNARESSTKYDVADYVKGLGQIYDSLLVNGRGPR